MADHNPMHFAAQPDAKPLCNINEAWRKPGEPERFVHSTNDPDKVTCFQCRTILARSK